MRVRTWSGEGTRPDTTTSSSMTRAGLLPGLGEVPEGPGKSCGKDCHTFVGQVVPDEPVTVGTASSDC
jgi:hypothetical protein